MPDRESPIPVLHLSPEHHATMLGHCYDGLPDEACGLLAGPREATGGFVPTGAVTSIHPCRNASSSSRVYRIDGRDYMAAERAASAAGYEIIGAWHSHTHTDAYPSPTDVEQAIGIQSMNGVQVFPIVSLRHAEPVLRAYSIDPGDGTVTEVPVLVE